MSLRSGLACVLTILFLTSGIAAGAEVGITPQPAAAADIEYDTTLLRVDFQEDGDARWTIEYRVDLNDENATDAFEALREDIRANRSEFEGAFTDRMNRTAQAAENTTGRGMAIRNMSVETDRDEIQQVGIVAYNFTWTNFAVADGDELRAGDAISGFVLDEGTTLFLTWPDAYGVGDVTPSADESSGGSATWFGQKAFTNDEPRLVLERAATTEDGPPGGTTTAVSDGFGLEVLVLVIGVVVCGLAAGGWYVWRRKGKTGPDATDDGGAGVAGAASGETAGEADAGSSGAVGEADSEEPPEELLSNEERVLRLLEANGGRMKQQQVVQELDWTDAKTSQVVGNLREDEEVEVFRIGRENVLALPGETDFR
jgi:hypothetical protein